MNVLIFILISLAISLASMPIIINICKKKNLYDYSNERKIHSGNIPRLGGIGIFFGFCIAAFFYLWLNKDLSFFHSFPLLLAAFIVFIFAILDDIFDLPALSKLIVQLCAVAIVTLNGYRFTQIFGWVLPTPFSFILSFGWILGVINAYNLIDGLDGLCGSLSFTTCLTLGIIYAVSGNYESGLCFILCAAIFGFLCFNWPPAKLFMGDNGSQFLGFMIATFPLYTTSDTFEYDKFLVMIILTAFPVFDTIAAIWRRLRDHQPIMTADKSHLHHKLLNMGYSKRTALYLIIFVQSLLCFSVIIAFILGTQKGTALLLEVLAFMILFFSIIHYSNRKVQLKKDKEKENVEKVEK